MPSILRARLAQKYRTIRYPDGEAPTLPDRWRGRPEINQDLSKTCPDAAAVCPTGALTCGKQLSIDMSRCIFCGACVEKLPQGTITFGKDFALSAFARADLVVGKAPQSTNSAIKKGGKKDTEKAMGEDPDKRLALIRSLFKRSLKLRQVSAGGCNACEADCNVLSTIAWDIGRFGIQFVASPRHADGILVTGPVTPNMHLALEKTYAAIPDPKIVIAVGACATSGGLHSPQPGESGLDKIFPVDLYVPGCPPHPLVILEGLLRLLGRV